MAVVANLTRGGDRLVTFADVGSPSAKLSSPDCDSAKRHDVRPRLQQGGKSVPYHRRVRSEVIASTWAVCKMHKY
ncbi:hypothetical protein PAXINDRAFT_173099 [Paxillus involutus ATCC 200175]|uniref:Uncharacterized protein n=1 Tax=Paxillus involutus ATCC 200175 TaxID=664439 RepID=A0A0C9TL91_PAXIN|nr:hypothetical protein PAXINDRAFT_173099 [Paxillus involutus ATCC 200175]